MRGFWAARANPPDELGGNSPHCAGDRGAPATEDVSGGCEAARGAKRGAGEVLETTEDVGPQPGVSTPLPRVTGVLVPGGVADSGRAAPLPWEKRLWLRAAGEFFSMIGRCK